MINGMKEQLVDLIKYGLHVIFGHSGSTFLLGVKSLSRYTILPAHLLEEVICLLPLYLPGSRLTIHLTVLRKTLNVFKLHNNDSRIPIPIGYRCQAGQKITS